MPHACKLQKWRDVYPWDWKMHNSNLICTEAAARWRIAHCMFMNRNHYRDWGAYRHGPVIQNFFLSSIHCALQHLKVYVLKCLVQYGISLAVVSLCIGLSLDLNISCSAWGPQHHSSPTFTSRCSYQISDFNSCAKHLSEGKYKCSTAFFPPKRQKCCLWCVWRERKCSRPVWEPRLILPLTCLLLSLSPFPFLLLWLADS